MPQQIISGNNLGLLRLKTVAKTTTRNVDFSSLKEENILLKVRRARLENLKEFSSQKSEMSPDKCREKQTLRSFSQTNCESAVAVFLLM